MCKAAFEESDKKLFKKKPVRKVQDSEVFIGEVCSGTDIAVFFSGCA